MGADCPGWPGTSSTAGLGMAESTFAGAEGKRMETCSPRPASAPAGGKMRGSPGTPRLPPGWRRASQREVGSSQGASNAPSDSHSATGPLPAAGRGHASCALPRGSVGKLCPENAARERSRVRTLRQAFLALQAALPSVPPDTKLSKLDVLVLATSYIAHLTHTLHQGQPPPEAAPLARAPSFLHPMKICWLGTLLLWKVILVLCVNSTLHSPQLATKSAVKSDINKHTNLPFPSSFPQPR
ncbi:hypothetical protein KIL84_017629 [Mauremys mutica]|uniref:BHLH domain-containing protein n=1 Tax=Mauremys mutica TaxID=74926 RepID=A0A9D4AYU1_9SAUR|nr:hypothetical protein KIL84_017629 [Mauremys mutica]